MKIIVSRMEFAPGEQYMAVDDDTYDGPGSLHGEGPTEIAAVQDFLDRLCDKLEADEERELVSRKMDPQTGVLSDGD